MVKKLSPAVRHSLETDISVRKQVIDGCNKVIVANTKMNENELNKIAIAQAHIDAIQSLLDADKELPDET